MKKSYLYVLCAAALLMTSCDSMLDKTPRDRFTESTSFWSNQNQVESYSNTFFENYVGYGTGTGGGWFYFKSLSDDQANPNFDNWTFVTVPGSSSYWSGNFTEIRRANYMINGMYSSTLPAATKAKYMAVARLNRAWEYYQLVRMYGDVQWENTVVLDPDADADVIYGARTDRDVVMDSVMNDINYAIDNIGSTSNKNTWSKNMALAMKSEIALYEGTYCKYRTAADNGKGPDVSRANTYFNACVDASSQLMSAGYALTTKYGEIYNSTDLTSCKEIIFYRNYEQDVQMHSVIDYTCSSSQQYGITKDAVNSFLFLDGKPLSTTTLDKSDKPILSKAGNYTINNMFAVRDKRLSVLLDSVLCFKGHGWSRGGGAALMTSSTAYNIGKYDNLSIALYYRNNTGTNYTDGPLYWLAEIYLNFAEAKAELGTITQDDLNNSINKLETRAGLPNLTLTPEADPANNMGVSNLIWEIRRCRRCELMTDNWIRYWDLVRWHQLDKLDTNVYTDVNRGANLSTVTGVSVSVDANGYAIPAGTTRSFDKKYYFFPIPSSQITLSQGKTTQNPGW
jgi:hypothetical protein